MSDGPEREADWRDFAAPVAVRPASPRHAAPPPATGRPGRPGRRTLPVALAIAVALAVLVVWRTGGGPAAGLASLGFGDQIMGGHSTAAPPVRHALDLARRAPAVTPPPGSGGWAPMYGTTAQPVRWDPCRPIRYVIGGRPLFSGGNQMLRSALRTVSRDTGLQFAFAGTTDEPATTHRPAYQPGRYGEQWAPVLIAWTDPAQVPQLAGNVIGRAGPDFSVIDGVARLVSGSVYLDDPDLAKLIAAPFGPSQVEGAMLHELGHLVGLAHSSDPNAVMYPTDHPNAGYDVSDLRGLAVMGAGPCYATY